MLMRGKQFVYPTTRSLLMAFIEQTLTQPLQVTAYLHQVVHAQTLSPLGGLVREQAFCALQFKPSMAGAATTSTRKPTSTVSRVVLIKVLRMMGMIVPQAGPESTSMGIFVSLKKKLVGGLG
jgi:hypothetical protein